MASMVAPCTRHSRRIARNTRRHHSIDSRDGELHNAHMLMLVKPDSPNLTASNFDNYLEKLLKAVDASKEVCIDLRAVRFVDLFASVGIAYTCHELHERLGCRVKLEVSPDEGCGGYLQRAGFFRVLPQDIQLPATVSRARLQWMEALEGNNPGLIELTPIISDQAISDVLDRLERVLRYRLHYPKQDAFDLLIVFSELCNNILDHNATDCYGLAAMQVYNPPSGRFMQFVVADRGAGIAATLRRNPRFAHLRTDADGIVAALELGASEHEESTRGNGLYHLLDLSFRHGGTIHIRSGTGKTYVRMDQERGRRFNVPQLTGTQFSIAFPDRRKRTI